MAAPFEPGLRPAREARGHALQTVVSPRPCLPPKTAPPAASSACSTEGLPGCSPVPGPDAGTSGAGRIGDQRPRERLPRLVLGALCVQQLVRLPVSLWGAAPPAPMAQARSLRPDRGVALLQGSGVAGTVSCGGIPSDVSLPETDETREYGRASAAIVFGFLIPSRPRPERLSAEPRLHSPL